MMMIARTPRLAVLVSGRGSNLRYLLDAIAADRLDAWVVGLFSDNPRAPALNMLPPPRRWARSISDFDNRDGYEAALSKAVAARAPDWVVCAGYMRILDGAFVQRFAGRLINIHPSLLPRYKGLDTHARAIAAGDEEHGATVHFVASELDAGPAIAQARVPVLPGDTSESLAARVLAVEHPLLVETLRLLVAGRVTMQEGKALLDGKPLASALLLENGKLTV